MLDSKMPLVSLIIPAKNEGSHVQSTIESALQVKTDYPFEIIVVDDSSTDGCCDFIADLSSEKRQHIQLVRTDGIGAAKARNLGAEQSKAKFLIFCDAHLLFENHWIDRLLKPIISGQTDAASPGIASIHAPELIGYGQTLDKQLAVRWNRWRKKLFQVAVLPGGCLALERNTFFDVGGFDRGFIVWGFEDIEISLKLWLHGYKCCVQPAVKVRHLFRSSHPYLVANEHVYYNLLRMAYSHFNDKRIEKCKSLAEKYCNVNQLLSQLFESDVIEQRQLYLSRRKYDDDWFIKKFRIPF